MVASDHGRYFVTLCYLRQLPAWDCMSIRLPMFSNKSNNCNGTVDGTVRYVVTEKSVATVEQYERAIVRLRIKFGIV